MIKVKTFNTKIKYNNSLTEAFRDMVAKRIGKLDTANSFMYLYRRFEEPCFTNKDEYKILYDYRFKHEDLLISVHASYYEFVNFSLHVPQKRFQAWINKRKSFWKDLYKKYHGEPFMPYSMIPWQGLEGLTKEESKKNLKLIDIAAEAYFSKEDNQFLEDNLNGSDNDILRKCFEMLRPFEQKLCKEFRSKLTKQEVKGINNWQPKIEDIEGLKKQCLSVIDDFKTGCYVRDVAINILGYESKTNVIKKYI